MSNRATGFKAPTATRVGHMDGTAMARQPAGRRCAKKGCRTILSRYNRSTICSGCENAKPKAALTQERVTTPVRKRRPGELARMRKARAAAMEVASKERERERAAKRRGAPKGNCDNCGRERPQRKQASDGKCPRCRATVKPTCARCGGPTNKMAGLNLYRCTRTQRRDGKCGHSWERFDGSRFFQPTITDPRTGEEAALYTADTFAEHGKLVQTYEP